jgi:DNA replication protein DnaC
LRVRSVTITVVACPICEDSGWKSIDVDGVERVTRCDCWRNNLQSSLLQEARIPRRYHHCQLSNFETHTDSQRTAHRKATHLVEQFPVVDKGLLFYGDAGVGKTHLAVALLKAIVERCRARALFFESRELLKMVRDTYGGGDTRELDVLRPVLEAEFLVLDDLGAEKKSEWVDETLGLIVNTRYSEKRVTVFTTNLSDSSNTEPTSFAYQLGLRTRSRLKEMCDWVHIDSVDTREVGTHPTPDDIAEWEAKSPASPKNRRGGMPSKTTGQARAQLKTRERDGRADLKWPGGRAGSQ